MKEFIGPLVFLATIVGIAVGVPHLIALENFSLSWTNHKVFLSKGERTKKAIVATFSSKYKELPMINCNMVARALNDQYHNGEQIMLCWKESQ